MPGILRRSPAAVLVGLLITVVAVCLLVNPAGAVVAVTLSNIVTPLVAAAAGVACLLCAVRRGGRSGLAWSGLGLGCFSYAWGAGTWSWIESVEGRVVPFLSLADVGYLAMVPLMAVGLLLLPGTRQSMANRVRSVVDGLMIACSLLLVSWILVLHPLIETGADTALALSVVLAYPIGDVVLVTVVLYTVAQLRREGQDSGPLMLIGTAMVVMGLADSAYAYLALHGSYTTGGLLDISWILCFALILLAARRAAPTRAVSPSRAVSVGLGSVHAASVPAPAAPAQTGAEQAGSARTDSAQSVSAQSGSAQAGAGRAVRGVEAGVSAQPFATLVPYAAVLCALICSVVFYAVSGHTDQFYAGCRSALILLIIARQLLTLLENRHLTRDLEARVAARSAELRASEQRFVALVQQSSDSVAIIEADSTVRYQSESVERIFGWPATRLLGRRLLDVLGADGSVPFAAGMATALREPGRAVTFELSAPHRDGRVRRAEMTVTNLLDDPGIRGLVLNTRDIHDARELQDRLVYEAYHDSLTGLASRALFADRVTAALTPGPTPMESLTSGSTTSGPAFPGLTGPESTVPGLTGPESAGPESAVLGPAAAGVAILVLDLDCFKEINDSLGHAIGDQLLIQVAARLKNAVREGDTVARIGGDEFGVVIVADTSAADVIEVEVVEDDAAGTTVGGDAEVVAARILAALREPFQVGERELRTTASIGLARAADAEDVGRLIRNADLAMYRAKSAGGDGLASYDPAMLTGLVERLQVEADLRAALTPDDSAHDNRSHDDRSPDRLARDELVLHYQPTVDLRTNEIIGFEALVRWQHPVRGMVSPLDFIGIAEATGLIVPLGRWVLAQACRQAVAWGAGGSRPLKMAVNVSVRQFEHADLSAMVAEVLAETGMPAGQLCLEMTESVLLTDTDENLTQLQRLKALGVTLAMDDFGTGYSSLAYLRRYPMDILKIDRSFVDRLGGDSADEALVRTIVRLGSSLGMTTVAEGIEDAHQLSVLRALHCDLAQGFYLSRPLPADAATRILDEGLPHLTPRRVMA